MRWYVLQVETGKELAVRDTLLAAGIPAKVPQELRPVRKGGSWGEKVYTLMPGYVFLGSDSFGQREYYAAKKIPGVYHFLGQPPHPISYLEAEYVQLMTPGDGPLEPSLVEDGRVVSGVLARFPGRVLKLDERRRRAKVNISIMGEEKPCPTTGLSTTCASISLTLPWATS